MSDLLTSAVGCLIAVAVRDAAAGALRASSATARSGRAARARAAIARRADLGPTIGDEEPPTAPPTTPSEPTATRVPRYRRPPRAGAVDESQILQEIAVGPGGATRRAPTHDVDAADELLEADTGLRLAAVQYDDTRDLAVLTTAADRFCGALTDRDRWAMRNYAERRLEIAGVAVARTSTSDEVGRLDRRTAVGRGRLDDEAANADNDNTVSGDRRAGGATTTSQTTGDDDE